MGEQAVMELEQCGTKEGQVDFGTLSIFGSKTSTKEHLSLSELTCVSICSEKTSPQLAVHTAARTTKLQPILLKFSSEAELYDWHGDLVAGMSCVHVLAGAVGGAIMEEINKKKVIEAVNEKSKELVTDAGGDDKMVKSDDMFLPCKANPLEKSVASTEVCLADDEPSIIDNEESIYTSTLESLEPSGRLILDWEDQYEGPDWGRDDDPVWVWVTIGGCRLDQLP